MKKYLRIILNMIKMQGSALSILLFTSTAKPIVPYCITTQSVEASLLNWGRALKKALQSYDLPTKLVKWREMAADRNQWRAVCGSKIPSATKETPTSSRQDIWAELRYGTVPS
jgi:hypothetical protein